MKSQDVYRVLAMPVVAPVLQKSDQSYPVALIFQGHFVKLTRDEAVNLAGEILVVVNRYDAEQMEVV